MSEMVERSVRAACNVSPEFQRWGGDEQTELVSAVIQAMREPTEAMIETVYDQSDPGFCDEPGMPTAPDDVWRQMIDEALK